ncbi:hypothetical protein Agub_g1449 [Astrephomene gubernaculifera]|uniref:Uncharacterized protein n=1 Tax=Astrephomene gubernaculifera TaxID=47775 RepID=A0AAD3HHH3_9CHLO|nr:hypothetical protein Agub_g1449 [Astrephomene gubernaculifera]
MVDEGRTEALGQYVDAHDILGDDMDYNELSFDSGPRESTSDALHARAASLDARQAAESRCSCSRLALDDSGELGPWSLPPAPTRNSSAGKESMRRDSHQEASTSCPGQVQPTGALPPINQRSNTKPARKASGSHQTASKRSQPATSQRVSSSKPNAAAQRYFQPPPPPPPPPKPKPRERHDISAVDPVYLQTAVYRTVPNVGRVYDWKVQHDVNAALSKQRKQQVQMEKVLEAARVQLQVREANERAFHQWVAAKEQEKHQQYQQTRRMAYVTSVYQNLVKEDPVEQKAREMLWVGNFGYPAASAHPAKQPVVEQGSESSDRFRL